MAASDAPVLVQVKVTVTWPLSLAQPADELFDGENESKTGPVDTGGVVGLGAALGAALALGVALGDSLGVALGVSLAVT